MEKGEGKELRVLGARRVGFDLAVGVSGDGGGRFVKGQVVL